MSYDLEEGYYDGELKGVEFSEDQYNPQAVLVMFHVQVGDKAVTCRHTTGSWQAGEPKDDNAERFKGVLDAFGITIKELNDIGKGQDTVRVRAKMTTKGNMRYYIAAQRQQPPMDKTELKRRIKNMTDEVPF